MPDPTSKKAQDRLATIEVEADPDAGLVKVVMTELTTSSASPSIEPAGRRQGHAGRLVAAAFNAAIRKDRGPAKLSKLTAGMQTCPQA
jgi:DNA-binding protein YbaB